MQRLGYRSFHLNGSLYQQQCRRLSDRSFRLANLLDIRAGQAFKTQISTGKYHPFFHSSQPERTPDLSKQILIDVRDDESAYKSGHIKDAIFLPRSRFNCYEFVDTKGGITFDEIYNTFRDIGVSNDTSEIVLYDEAGENVSRLYYVMRYFGFNNVRILQGGYGAWKEAGLPEDTEIVSPKPSSDLRLKATRPEILVRPTQMMENHKAQRSQIIDTRSPEEFKVNAIQRAVNIPASKFQEKPGYFKKVKDIRDLMRSEGFDVENNSKGHIVLYSNKARSSSIAYFALNMVGFDRLAVYDQGIDNWVLNQDKKLTMDQTEAFGR